MLLGHQKWYVDLTRRLAVRSRAGSGGIIRNSFSENSRILAANLREKQDQNLRLHRRKFLFLIKAVLNIMFHNLTSLNIILSADELFLAISR
jgi:hypothetical protein